ncbi:GyrI-like domain-containing protein [Paenibacillus flagellatus]|uniref:AraC family transcriptional regulator n=1 Tax=Paenibacillus flagellatus TaxID=2211139 RepID=A0A2V5K098_9BACL|nr:GyrI-like domain-containing protein [Paenibacillus flagellatus]PYI52501.1 AraC family transcriptional regulator [Paenibacillus flagellatus]
MDIRQAHRAGFELAGITVRTNNKRESGAQGELPKLWERFYRDGTAQAAGDSRIYALYTEYEREHHGDYTVLVGFERKEGMRPEGGVVKQVPEADYLVFRSEKGPVYRVVAEAWGRIWDYFETSSIRRTYTGDFEVYEASADPNEAIVDIYVAVDVSDS